MSFSVRLRYEMRSVMAPIFRWCASAKRSRSGRRAIVPSSFMISHRTAAGENPASRARSQHASVWPARPCTLLGDRHANQATTELRHEVDRLGRNAIGRDDEIAFVLPILFVDENDDAPVAKVSDDVLDRCDRHRARKNVATRNRYVTGTA